MKKILSIAMSLFIVLGCFNIVTYAAIGYDKTDIEKYVGQKIIDLNYYHSSGGYYPYQKRLDKNGDMQCVGYVYARLEEKLGLSPDFSSGTGAKDIPGNAPNGSTRTSISGKKYTIEVYTNDNGSHLVDNCWVSFGAGSSTYGHVIYVEEVIGDNVYYTESGTNWWRNGTAGTLKKKNKDDFLNKCDSGGRYVGTVVFRPNSTHNHKYDASTETCTICGEKFSYTYTNINKTYKVIKNKVSLKSRPYQDYGTIYTKLKSGTKVTVNKSFKNVFGNTWYEVSYGNYTGYMYWENLEEYNESGVSTLEIKMTDWPASIKVGSSYGLRGNVTSDKTITKIEGYVQNSSGSNILTSVDYPNKTSVDVKNANLNSKLTFNKLSAGNYKLIVKAYDSSGKCVTTSKNFNVYSEQKKADSSLSINLEKYPVSINQGSSYGLRGSVTSNYNVSEVRGYVINSSGKTVLSSKDYPNAKSMDIRYADLNNSLSFNKLSAGSYTMKVVAYDTSGRQLTATKKFTVQGSGGNSGGKSSSLSINMTSYPSSINKGSSFGLRGSVTSNCNITKVTGYVINSSGKTVLSSTDKPNSTSMDVRYANLNNDLVFNKLDSGSYTLKVVATDSSGKTKEWSSGFTVSGGKAASSNTRTGIVNIPSSWDNLSIRSGPSTNYKIVGSMNQGARCTVYTDKTSNGWYYVEYNGVKGYASGKQINLQ